MTEVSIEGLSKLYGGGTKAVDRISMKVADGEFVSLLGPSGCGKTTTLKMIAGFEDPSEGAIRFDGRDVVHTPAEKRDIGMVFQNYALFPHMTVAGNLAFGLEMRKVPRPEIEARVRRILDMIQLSGLPDRYPSQLSGGQQQRVALGRALVIEPTILLLDEPLANLDAKLREEMRVFIRDLQRSVGITTIYVTHDQAEAMAMSDRVAVMFGGRIAQMAAPTDIYQRPESLAVARFVGQVNLVKAVMKGRGEGGRLRVESAFGSFDVEGRSNAAPGSAVTLVLRPESIELSGPDRAGGTPGTVVAQHYSGSLFDYDVRLDGGESLHVQAFPHTRFAAGDAVRLHAPPDRFWLLDETA